MSTRVRDVLSAVLDGCDGLLELRAKSSAGVVRTTFMAPDAVTAIAAFVTAHHPDDVWFGVATRHDASSGALENCQQLGALFTDLDCDGNAQQLADAEARLAAFPLPVSCIIRSGGGLHCYWLLREPADVQVEGPVLRMWLRRLAVSLGGDLAAAECARVLRLPGTRNYKPAYGTPRPVTIHTFEPDRRYNVGEFDFLPSEPIPTAATSADVLDLSTIATGERNRTLYRLGRSLKAKSLPAAAIVEALRATNATCRPPLDARELDAIIRQVTTQPDRLDFVADIELEATASSARRAVLTRLADIEPQAIEYIWPGRIARGRLNLLIGDPGLGKSFVLLDVAARVTRGARWPDGGRAPLGDVIDLSAEDHAADTIRPRADALGADVSRIHVLSAVRVEGTSADQDQPFSLVTDLPLLDAAFVETGGILGIIDPVSAYLGTKLDSYKDAHVRSVFGPLAALAERRNVAIVGIMHLSKGTDRRALYRALGSVAFVAAARLVLAVAPHPDEDDARVLVPVKSNICAPATTLAYRLTDGRLTWDTNPVLSVTADQVLSNQVLGRHERQDAVEWLRTVLADGQVPVTILQQEAKAAGMAWRTVERAKAQLGVDAVRLGGLGAAGQWCWFLKPKSAIMLALVPKTVPIEDVADLGADPINTHDFTGSDAKAATFQTVTDLAPTPDTLPAWVTDDGPPLEPGTSDVAFADHDEDDDVRL